MKRRRVNSPGHEGPAMVTWGNKNVFHPQEQVVGMGTQPGRVLH